MAWMAALGALAMASVLGAVAPPVDASTAYRYWSYWNAPAGAPEWTYATQGSGTHIPGDGAVEGWRFGVAGESSTMSPRFAAAFAAICDGVDVPEDGKRVAIVIDPGNAHEAPAGQTPGALRTECVTGSASATGLQLLQTVTGVRMDAGFVCGIDGYPTGECAPMVEVSDVTVHASTEVASTEAASAEGPTAAVPSSVPVERSASPGSDVGSPLITAAALSLLALVGFTMWRRSRRGHG